MNERLRLTAKPKPPVYLSLFVKKKHVTTLSNIAVENYQEEWNEYKGLSVTMAMSQIETLG